MVNTDPYPDAPGQAGNIKNIQALTGIGAFTIDDSTEGSGTNFGQDITGEDFVKSFVYSTAMNMGPGDGTIASTLTNLGTFLNTMSLDALKLLQPFIPGATDDQFADTETAVETILAQFNIQLMMSIEAFQQWLDDIFNPNSYLWADAKAWWDTVFAQLNSYPPVGSSAATVATWWSTLLVDLGVDPTLSATIANVISGNYDWAKQSKAWWDQILAALGLSSGTAVGTLITGHGTNISTQQAWWNSLSQAIWVSLDWFHVTYPLGSPSDTATTTVGGKMTWYASQAALKALFTTVGSTPAAVAAVPPGDVITANTGAAATAASNAATAIASNQALNDAIVNATGTPGTGFAATDAQTGLENFPASNVIGVAAAAVAYGATGGGNAVNGSTSTLSTSWSHSIATGDGEVLIGVSYSAAAAGTWGSSVTYNGSSAGVTLLASISLASSIAGTTAFQDVYVLKAPPTGSKTIAATVTRLSGTGVVNGLYGNSLSYAASKVGAVNTYTGGGSTALSMTAASATGKMVVGFFTSYVNNNNTLSSFSQTQRYNRGYTSVGLAAAYGDGPGSGSVVFAATSPYSTQQYCGVTVEISN